jgi:hypothetical protein
MSDLTNARRSGGESPSSGVAWAAIIGGTLTAMAVAIMLGPIGAALGYASASPWSHAANPVKAFSIATAIWLVVVQWISAGLGGYITGRLRTKWVGAHTHEVFFRDTVHGFLTWALASVIGALLLFAATMGSGRAGMPGGADVSPTVMFAYSLSMFVGAFISCVTGALGGHDRDIHYETGKFSL